MPKLSPNDETFLLTKSRNLWASAQAANLDPLKNATMRDPKADAGLLMRYWVAKDIDRVRECYEFYNALKLKDASAEDPRFTLGFHVSQEAYELTMRVALLDDELKKSKTVAWRP